MSHSTSGTTDRMSTVSEPLTAMPTSQSVLPSDDDRVTAAVSDPDPVPGIPSLGDPLCLSPHRSTRVSKPPLHFYKQFDL